MYFAWVFVKRPSKQPWLEELTYGEKLVGFVFFSTNRIFDWLRSMIKRSHIILFFVILHKRLL